LILKTIFCGEKKGESKEGLSGRESLEGKKKLQCSKEGFSSPVVLESDIDYVSVTQIAFAYTGGKKRLLPKGRELAQGKMQWKSSRALAGQ